MISFKKYSVYMTAFFVLAAPFLHIAGHAFAHEINSVHLHGNANDVHAHEHEADHDPVPVGNQHHVNISELNRTLMKQRSCEFMSHPDSMVRPLCLPEPAFVNSFWIPSDYHRDLKPYFYSHLANAPPA